MLWVCYDRTRDDGVTENPELESLLGTKMSKIRTILPGIPENTELRI